MGVLDIYRHEPDGSFGWIATADSVRTARAIIKSCAANPLEEFLICDDRRNERITVRADGRWLPNRIQAVRAEPIAHLKDP